MFFYQPLWCLLVATIKKGPFFFTKGFSMTENLTEGEFIAKNFIKRNARTNIFAELKNLSFGTSYFSFGGSFGKAIADAKVLFAFAVFIILVKAAGFLIRLIAFPGMALGRRMVDAAGMNGQDRLSLTNEED